MSAREYKTQDMTCAAYLMMQGFDPLRCEEVDGDTFAAMFFDLDDEGLMDEVDVFHAGEARVEPKAFQRKIAIARTQLREAAESTHG